ncbi:MAG: 3-hydroxyacyl-ACP dehydratase FabZ family protein [Pseudomonadota bacterium]
MIAGANDNELSYDSMGIQSCQQNRPPLLFIDAVTRAIPGKAAFATKNFTYNEWFFPAHFEDDPNVPGFIQIECLVQTFIMTFLCMDEYKGQKTNFLSINNVKFKRKIIPGDVLHIEAQLDSLKRGIAKGSSEGSVDGVIACSAEFIVSIPDVFANFKPR